MEGRIKTTGQLRAFLAETLERTRAGLVDLEVAGKITKMAGQINESFYAETKVARVQVELGNSASKLGELSLSGKVEEDVTA